MNRVKQLRAKLFNVTIGYLPGNDVAKVSDAVRRLPLGTHIYIFWSLFTSCPNVHIIVLNRKANNVIVNTT